MTLHALLYERPKMSGALAVVACLALVGLSIGIAQVVHRDTLPEAARAA